MSFISNIALSILKPIAKAAVTNQLQIIKKNNPATFYVETLRTLDHGFKLLAEGVHDKSGIVAQISELVTQPVEQAASLDNIPL